MVLATRESIVCICAGEIDRAGWVFVGGGVGVCNVEVVGLNCVVLFHC